MPREKGSLIAMLLGDEPGPLARLGHNLTGGGEGDWGEKCLLKLLKNRTTDGTAIWQNLYVPRAANAGQTTELDIVLAGRTGIYVFESKAYGGKIYGRPEQLNWQQYLGGGKNSFYNPIRQNENHRLSLAKALNVPLDYILSFIVFENRADLSGLTQTRGNNFIVCNRRELPKFLQMITAIRPEVFSKSELAAICAQLTQWSGADEQTRLRHIQQLQDVCPFCGGKLVERRGKYGAFIGCSGYPKCRYTRKI